MENILNSPNTMFCGHGDSYCDRRVVWGPQLFIEGGDFMANVAEMLQGLTQERSRMVGQVRKLDKAIVVLRKLTKGGGPAAFGRGRKKRTMSAAARRRISAAQKARWAKWKQKQTKKAA